MGHQSSQGHSYNRARSSSATSKLPPFSKLDKNGDGHISRKEYRQWKQKHEQRGWHHGQQSQKSSNTMSGTSTMGGSSTMGGASTMDNPSARR
jgi:hypothetical protein